MLHSMTTSENYELRVDLEDFENNTAYAKYRYEYFENENKAYNNQTILEHITLF